VASYNGHVALTVQNQDLVLIFSLSAHLAAAILELIWLVVPRLRKPNGTMIGLEREGRQIVRKPNRIDCGNAKGQ